jgi:hypothetical protein
MATNGPRIQPEAITEQNSTQITSLTVTVKSPFQNMILIDSAKLIEINRN